MHMLLAIINMLIIIIMLQLLIFIVHFMCLMKLPIPTICVILNFLKILIYWIDWSGTDKLVIH